MSEFVFLVPALTSGDYAYQTIHWVTLAVVVTVFVALALVAANKRVPDKVKDIMLISVAVFQLAFELAWRIKYWSGGSKVMALWPFYPCNLAGILIPIAFLIKNTRMKDYFYLFGFIGGVITFVYPVGIFVYPTLSFGILKSILQHTGIIIIPLCEYVRGTYRPRLENFGCVLLGIIIHIANSYGLSYVFGYPGDYMYVFSGLPFEIPGVPQYITFSSFALVILALFNWAVDPKGVGRMIKARRERRSQVQGAFDAKKA